MPILSTSNISLNTAEANVSSLDNRALQGLDATAITEALPNILTEVVTDEKTLNNIKITSFIRGEDKREDDNNSLEVEVDHFLSLENNKHNVLTENKLNSIKNYTNNCIENYYNHLENKVDMLLSVNNNNKTFINNYFEKTNTFNNLKINLLDAIKEKISNIKLNNYESKVKEFVQSDNASTYYFNTVNKHFLSNINIEKNKKVLNRFNYVTSYSNELSSNTFETDFKNTLQKHCMLNFSLENDSNEKTISTAINSFNIQNIVTMIRNAYFLSPRCLFDNYNSESFNEYEVKNDNFIVYTTEVDSFDIFSNINFSKNTINTSKISESNIISRARTSQDFTYPEYYITNDSISVLDGVQYLPLNLQNYIDSTMIQIFKTAEHIKNKDYNDSIKGLFLPLPSIVFAHEINKAFTGEFFNIDLAKIYAFKDLGAQELLTYFLFGTADSSSNINNKVNLICKRNFLNKANDEIIYNKLDSITEYVRQSSNNSGQIKNKNNFNLDNKSKININDLDQKISIDSLVKKYKLSNAKNKMQGNIDFFEEVISSINSASVKDRLVAYCKDDVESISIINKDSSLFDLFFTSNDDESIFYSHIDLVSNHSINNVNFKGYQSLVKDNLLPNEKYKELSDSIKEFISYYYPSNNLFSSSNLYYKILKSIINEAEAVEFDNYEEYNNTQSLYLNYFKPGFSNNISAKKLIAERFIKKAVQLDEISSPAFSKNEGLLSFMYDPESFDINDLDVENKNEFDTFIEAILNTSEKLKIIKSTVFSHDNIKDLSKASDFRRVSNLKIVAGNGLSEIEDLNINNFGLGAIINFNVFPNYSMLYNFNGSKNFEEDSNIKFDIQTKNKIGEIVEYGELNPNTNKKEILTQTYFIKKDFNFDVTKSKKIKIKVTPKLNSSLKNRDNYSYPSFVLSDEFESIFDSEERESFVFYKIIDIIQDMLRMKLGNYLDINISSESDIDNLIINDDILLDVIALLETYSELYLTFSSRLQRNNAIKIFSWQKKDIVHGSATGYSNSNFSHNGIISKHSEVYNSFKDVMELQENDNIQILSSSDSTLLVSDIIDITNFYLNVSSFKDLSTVKNICNTFSTHTTDIVYKVLYSLFMSDYSQALNFDLVNGFLNFQEKIITSDPDDVVSSKIFDKIEGVSKNFVENIESKFYDMFFINKLSKSLNYMDIKNKVNSDFFDAIFKLKDYDYFINNNIFEKSKNFKVQKMNKLSSNIVNNNISKISFCSSRENFLNANFNSFSVSSKNMNNKNEYSIVKIKVTLIDQFNTNRLYIPKTYYFSPMITDVLFLTSEFIQNTNLQDKGGKKIGLFNTDNPVEERLLVENFNSLLNSNSNFLIDIVKQKFKNFGLNDQEYINLYKHLLYCHSSSEEIYRLLKYSYKFNNKKGTYKSNISTNVHSLVAGLNEKQYFDIFNEDKSNFEQKLIFDEVSQTYAIKGENSAFNLLRKLENLHSLEEIEEAVNGKNYDIYNVAVNPLDFYYIDIAEEGSDNLNQNVSEEKYTLDESDILLLKLNNMNSLTSRNNFKKDLLNLEKFNMIFEAEII